jgi:hypothetical protein
MVKLALIFAGIAALILYLGFREDGIESAPQPAPKVQTQQRTEEEPVKTAIQERSISQKKHVEEKQEKPVNMEELISNTEEQDEIYENEIAEDERAEDYYNQSDVPPKGTLVGDADIEWIEPDKSEKINGEFGRPPQIY